MSKGYVHLYTGNGKGKTTAAFGVVVRMLMSDKRVYVGQFIKGMKYSETRLEDFFDQIEIVQYGLDCFIENDPTEEDFKRAEIGFREALRAVGNPKNDLVVLDEIFIAHYYKMLSLEQLQELIVKKAPSVELIMTGRYCPEDLYDSADLVTEMTEIKHYYKQGVLSREGVDC
jgi:cob(I)alamin adenosyltransferase